MSRPSAAMLVTLLLAAGCAQGARFERIDEQGGVVIYPLKKGRESIYATPHRAEALKMIEAHCHGAYLITREGETAAHEINSGRDDDDMVTIRRFWGLQFRCT